MADGNPDGYNERKAGILARHETLCRNSSWYRAGFYTAAGEERFPPRKPREQDAPKATKPDSSDEDCPLAKELATRTAEGEYGNGDDYDPRADAGEAQVYLGGPQHDRTVERAHGQWVHDSRDRSRQWVRPRNPTPDSVTCTYTREYGLVKRLPRETDYGVGNEGNALAHRQPCGAPIAKVPKPSITEHQFLEGVVRGHKSGEAPNEPPIVAKIMTEIVKLNSRNLYELSVRVWDECKQWIIFSKKGRTVLNLSKVFLMLSGGNKASVGHRLTLAATKYAEFDNVTYGDRDTGDRYCTLTRFLEMCSAGAIKGEAAVKLSIGCASTTGRLFEHRVGTMTSLDHGLLRLMELGTTGYKDLAEAFRNEIEAADPPPEPPPLALGYEPPHLRDLPEDDPMRALLIEPYQPPHQQRLAIMDQDVTEPPEPPEPKPKRRRCGEIHAEQVELATELLTQQVKTDGYVMSDQTHGKFAAFLVQRLRAPKRVPKKKPASLRDLTYFHYTCDYEGCGLKFHTTARRWNDHRKSCENKSVANREKFAKRKQRASSSAGADGAEVVDLASGASPTGQSDSVEVNDLSSGAWRRRDSNALRLWRLLKRGRRLQFQRRFKPKIIGKSSKPLSQLRLVKKGKRLRFRRCFKPQIIGKSSTRRVPKGVLRSLLEPQQCLTLTVKTDDLKDLINARRVPKGVRKARATSPPRSDAWDYPVCYDCLGYPITPVGNPVKWLHSELGDGIYWHPRGGYMMGVLDETMLADNVKKSDTLDRLDHLDDLDSLEDLETVDNFAIERKMDAWMSSNACERVRLPLSAACREFDCQKDGWHVFRFLYPDETGDTNMVDGIGDSFEFSI